MIIETEGTPAVLEQLAEECMELAHAALKLSRKLRGESPTPKSLAECIDAMTEETADVMCCIDQLNGVVDQKEVSRIRENKEQRWKLRLRPEWQEGDKNEV